MKTGLLFSGGMDSTALAFWKRPDVAYTIDYGQLPAEGEIRAAKAVCTALNIQHSIIRIDCRSLGSGDMAGTSAIDCAPVPEWWPYRNQLLVTLSAARALADGVSHLFVGSVRTDGKHADGQHRFFELIDDLVKFQEGGLRVSAPAIEMDSVELIRNAGIPLSVLAWSHSCHVSARSCGTCRGCVKHAEVMGALGHGIY